MYIVMGFLCPGGGHLLTLKDNIIDCIVVNA